MKKAWLYCAVALVAVSLVFAGCGGKKEESKPAQQQQKTESVADLFAKGKSLPGMSYDYVVTVKDMKMEGKMAISGKKMRTEMTAQNQKMVSIVDGDANVAYTYIPDQKTAMKIALDQAKAEKTPDSFTKEADAPKFKVLETTTYEGVKCKVLLMEDAEKKIQTKMWVREDYGVPMRVEVTEAGEKKMVMEYKNMKIGAVPPESFKLPEGTQIMDMGDMMKNMPKKQ